MLRKSAGIHVSLKTQDFVYSKSVIYKDLLLFALTNGLCYAIIRGHLKAGLHRMLAARHYIYGGRIV